MVWLYYLKYTFDYSDEAVVSTFLENPYWQYFCGQKYFVHDFQLTPGSMTRWRKRLDKTGLVRSMSNVKEGMFP